MIVRWRTKEKKYEDEYQGLTNKFHSLSLHQLPLFYFTIRNENCVWQKKIPYFFQQFYRIISTQRLELHNSTCTDDDFLKISLKWITDSLCCIMAKRHPRCKLTTYTECGSSLRTYYYWYWNLFLLRTFSNLSSSKVKYIYHCSYR